MKRDDKDTTGPVFNWITGEVEYEVPGGFIIGNDGQTKVRVGGDLVVDLESGDVEVVSSFSRRRRKRK